MRGGVGRTHVSALIVYTLKRTTTGGQGQHFLGRPLRDNRNPRYGADLCVRPPLQFLLHQSETAIAPKCGIQSGD